MLLSALGLCGCQTVGLAVINASAPTVALNRNIAFEPGPRGSLDLYAPPAAALADTAPPLVVFWYGGAWIEGRKEDYGFVGAALAAQGMLVAVPDYRLYPEVRFPAFLQDAARAVALAQREAVSRGADPLRTVLGGHSAGAWIAAMLALEPSYLREAGVDPDSIVGFFGLSGPYALEPNSPRLREIFSAQAPDAQFQPVAQVTPAAPPALLIHGGADRLVVVEHSRRLAEALREQGVPVQLLIYPGRRHIDTVAALSRPVGFRIPGLVEQISAFVAAQKRRSPDAVP
jgi:acetyl esterase/lipase